MKKNLALVLSTAHHEAAHVTIATTLGIQLHRAGIRIDSEGEGIAFYEMETNNSYRCIEAHVLTLFAGYQAQRYFFRGKVRPATIPRDPIDTFDWGQARHLLSRLPQNDSLNVRKLQGELEKRSLQLVIERWAMIAGLANILFSKEETPMKVFAKSPWSNQATERFLTGEEVIDTLSHFGIFGSCAEDV